MVYNPGNESSISISPLANSYLGRDDWEGFTPTREKQKTGFSVGHAKKSLEGEGEAVVDLCVAVERILGDIKQAAFPSRRGEGGRMME